MAKPALRKISTNNTFNCEIEIQTVRQRETLGLLILSPQSSPISLSQGPPLDNDKEMRETDALSLIILELNYSRPFDPESDSVQVSFAGKYSQESTC